MKKKIITRSLLGFPLGISLGYVISIAISVIISSTQSSENFYPCVPIFVETMGSEINAVIVQTFLCGLMGSTFACSSLIWENDSWSIAKQTGIYFFVTSLVMMPIAYFTNWMEHTIAGVLGYFGIFVLIFIIVWLIQYAKMRATIRKINSSLS